MKHKIRIWIASVDKTGKNLSKPELDKAITGLAYILSKLNGGVTQYKAKGYWVNSEDRLVTEPVTILESFTDKLDKSKKDYLRELAKELKAMTRQESVAIELDGKMEMV
jgi:hypothetical protein